MKFISVIRCDGYEIRSFFLVSLLWHFGITAVNNYRSDCWVLTCIVQNGVLGHFKTGSV